MHYFDVVHTVDRLEVAAKLDLACQKISKIMPVFIQVNLDCESQKAGVFPEQLSPFLMQVKKYVHLDVQGLMMIPAVGQFSSFARLQKLRNQLEQQVAVALPRLSMGMSQDYDAAIREGATDVRIGEAIFGKR